MGRHLGIQVIVSFPGSAWCFWKGKSFGDDVWSLREEYGFCFTMADDDEPTFESTGAATVHAAVCRRFDRVDHVYLVLIVEQATFILFRSRTRKDDLLLASQFAFRCQIIEAVFVCEDKTWNMSHRANFVLGRLMLVCMSNAG